MVFFGFLGVLCGMQRGVLITFEGSEGCGKSTQIELLAQYLEDNDKPTLVLREPGGTPLGEVIRHVLKYSAEAKGIFPETELLLFAASRAQLVREVILPALEKGTYVLCDRFYDSTTVYQGFGRGLPLEIIETLNHFASAGRRPDLTLLFDMSSEEALKRMMRRPKPVNLVDRMETEPPEFYERVRQEYLHLARANPERFVVVDATRSIVALEDEIRKILEDRNYGVF